MAPNGRSSTRRVSNRPVSAWARHSAKNRLNGLINLVRGWREEARGWGCTPIPVQPDAQFGIGATELIRREWTIANGTIVRAARFVLSQRVRPPRSRFLDSAHHHPDDTGIVQWL